MENYKVLVFTDHSGHSMENSIYTLLQALNQHPNCRYIDVASRALATNQAFFQDLQGDELTVSRVDKSFQYDKDGSFYHNKQSIVKIQDYDVLFLRLPYPIRPGFWTHLTRVFPERQIINQPTGIQISGNKQFLLELQEWCPPIRLCKDAASVLDFASQFPIVLKPLKGYGGKGIIKIDQNRAWSGNQEIDLATFLSEMDSQQLNYLGMKYLKNVSQGDKRIVVIYGKVIGASLRMPAEDSWLCNASQGGSSIPAALTSEEESMAKALTERLTPIGVPFFGFDTLVDDSGKRVLSEVNTLSIGGIKQIAAQQKYRPVIAESAQQIISYIQQEIFA